MHSCLKKAREGERQQGDAEAGDERKAGKKTPVPEGGDEGRGRRGRARKEEEEEEEKKEVEMGGRRTWRGGEKGDEHLASPLSALSSEPVCRDGSCPPSRRLELSSPRLRAPADMSLRSLRSLNSLRNVKGLRA